MTVESAAKKVLPYRAELVTRFGDAAGAIVDALPTAARATRQADIEVAGAASSNDLQALIASVLVLVLREQWEHIQGHTPLTAAGVNIHAEVVIGGGDRKRLEHVFRYMARPPLALDRLELREDGQITYRFKKAWRDGTHAVVLSPEDFIARLCALVPPPRFHLMRYLGVLAGHSSLRAEVVPKRPVAPPVAESPTFAHGQLRLAFG